MRTGERGNGMGTHGANLIKIGKHKYLNDDRLDAVLIPLLSSAQPGCLVIQQISGSVALIF